MKRTRLLVCDDDQLFWSTLRLALKSDYDLDYAASPEETWERLDKMAPYALILLDLCFRTQDEGFALLPKIKARFPTLPVLIISGISSLEAVLQAMRLGATDYLPKEYGMEELKRQIRHALDRQSRVLAGAAAGLPAEHALIGRSHAIRELTGLVERIRTTSLNVVLFGEPGVGKEVIAHMLGRARAGEKSKPFVPVDSSTIPLSMAESYLFGHERGSFTGADRLHKGVFEQANGGVIYFDEIANMPYEVQAKLLRVLQEKEVLRIGSASPVRVEFRVICATNRDIESMSQSGQFRFDLFSRLNMVSMYIPPLRERIDDLPMLVAHFAERFALSASPLQFSDAALEVMARYPWPANIRELSNLVQFLGVTCDHRLIEPQDLPSKLRSPPSLRTSAAPDEVGYYDRIRNFERKLLQREYEQHAGNVSRMAKALQMDRSHLFEKLKDLGIHKPGKA